MWTEKLMVPYWLRGPESGSIVAPAEHPLAITALGMSIATPEEGITAEVVEVASLEELRELGEERVRGKIVLYNKPIYPNGGRERGYGSAVGLRWAGAVEAAKLGAVATMIRSLGTADFRLPHTGSMGYEDGVERIPAAAISAEDAELINRFLAAGDTVRVTLKLGCKMLPDVESANVLADLRGREKPDEIVLIGAHLDSWDVGTGAIDDGAGVAIVMETMRLLKAHGLVPRRTIRAVAVHERGERPARRSRLCRAPRGRARASRGGDRVGHGRREAARLSRQRRRRGRGDGSRDRGSPAGDRGGPGRVAGRWCGYQSDA